MFTKNDFKWTLRVSLKFIFYDLLLLIIIANKQGLKILENAYFLVTHSTSKVLFHIFLTSYNIVLCLFMHIYGFFLNIANLKF